MDLSCTCPGHVPDASRTSPYYPVFWPMSHFHEDTGQAPKCQSRVSHVSFVSGNSTLGQRTKITELVTDQK